MNTNTITQLSIFDYTDHALEMVSKSIEEVLAAIHVHMILLGRVDPDLETICARMLIDCNDDRFIRFTESIVYQVLIQALIAKGHMSYTSEKGWVFTDIKIPERTSITPNETLWNNPNQQMAIDEIPLKAREIL